MKRKVCVVTGTRADYGLLCPLMKEVVADPDMRLQIIATCMHLSPEFGSTYKDIERDGFRIDKRLEILLSSDSPIGISKSMGLAHIALSEAYDELKPDIVALLGDRFEAFCAASTASVARIPIAHIAGGESTQGAFDEAFRHSITKMSHIHLTSTEEYRNRVIQLGEHPDMVFNVGAIGIENIRKLPLLSRKDLEKEIRLAPSGRYFLVTFHPVTLEKSTAENQFGQVLEAVDALGEEVRVVFTKANADTDGRIVNKMIDQYVTAKPSKAVAFTSMGQILYLSALKYAEVVLGNSSSGIVEAPTFRVPTINIGDRQKGRIQSSTVLNCRPEKGAILKAIHEGLSPEFQNALKSAVNPYEKEGTARNIKDIIKGVQLQGLLKKTFYDLRVK